MSFREINYIVTKDNISPKAAQNGGVQGEDNSVEVIFDVSAITLSENDFLRIDIANGAGGFNSSQHLTVTSNKVKYALPYDVTVVGGIAQLHLVITTIENGVEEVIKYSYPARIYFESSAAGSVNYNNYRKGLSGLALECTNAKNESQQYANEANNSAEIAQTAERNAEYALSQMNQNILPQHIATHFRLDKQVAENDTLAGFVDFYFKGENHRYMLSTKNAEEFADGQYKLQIYKDLSINDITISKNEMQDYIAVAVVSVNGGAFSDLWAYNDEYLFERFNAIDSKVKILQNEMADKAPMTAVTSIVSTAQAEDKAYTDSKLSQMANALTTIVSGGAIVRCDDVSPIEHKLNICIHGNSENGVNVSNPKMYVYGKNFLNDNNEVGKTFSSNGMTATKQADGGWALSGAPSQFTVLNIVTNGIPIELKSGHIYSLSGGFLPQLFINLKLFDNNGNYLVTIANTGGAKTFTAPENVASYTIQIQAYAGAGDVTGKVIYPQIELGEIKTEYELYKEPEIVDMNGASFKLGEYSDVEIITAVAPTSTILVTDDNNLVNSVDVAYNRDLVKVINKIEQSLL